MNFYHIWREVSFNAPFFVHNELGLRTLSKTANSQIQSATIVFFVTRALKNALGTEFHLRQSRPEETLFLLKLA